MKSFLVAVTFALVAGLGVLALKEEKNVVTCKICLDLVQVVDDALVSNQTIDDIESALDAWCDLLTGLEASCKEYVAEHLAEVINLLVDEYLNPQEVCDYLYLCP